MRTSSQTAFSSLLLTLVGLASAAVVDVSPARLFPRASSACSTTGSVSCHNATAQSNLCCFESPGGLLLQTQFWDLSGPAAQVPTTWTVHGLWPDNCDGTFKENCDSSRDYTGISNLVSQAGQTELLSFMNNFWLNINGDNEELWEHEWATHGTCFSTLEPTCLPAGSPRGTEAIDYFLTVEKLFKSLPTYEWLQQAGITPSSTRTLTLSEITGALQNAAGVVPALDCDGSNLSQISWYFNLQGSMIDGKFIPINAPQKGSCASSGLKYPPKPGGGSGTSTSSTGGSTPTGAPGSVPTKSTISILTSSGSKGGVLTAGTWSVQTPATFTATASGTGFTLKTSKGSCGVSNGQFMCGSGVTTSIFGATQSSNNLLLTFGGSSAFTADSVPSGIAQISIFTGSSHTQDISLAFNAS